MVRMKAVLVGIPLVTLATAFGGFPVGGPLF